MINGVSIFFFNVRNVYGSVQENYTEDEEAVRYSIHFFGTLYPLLWFSLNEYTVLLTVGRPLNFILFWEFEAPISRLFR